MKCFQTGLRFALFRGLLLKRIVLVLVPHPSQVWSVSMMSMMMFFSQPDLPPY